LAQDYFSSLVCYPRKTTTTETEAIKSFVHSSFEERKDCMVTAMAWMQRGDLSPPGMDLRAHAGGAGSYHAWVGFDKKQRRGVVVLSTAEIYSVEQVGQLVLRHEPLRRENLVENTYEPVGIGASLELDQTTHLLRITRIISNTPAFYAGLSAGLMIQRIDDIATTSKTLAENVNLLRGKAGTKVRLDLINSDQNTTNTVELTRQKFVLVRQ
jgi:hypothetical protein